MQQKKDNQIVEDRYMVTTLPHLARIEQATVAAFGLSVFTNVKKLDKSIYTGALSDLTCGLKSKCIRYIKMEIMKQLFCMVDKSQN